MVKKSKPDQRVPAYNGWMFARDVARHLFTLLNTGKAYPAFFLLLIGVLGIIAWRLPPDQIAPVVVDFLATIRGSVGLAVSAFVMSNFGWAWLFARMRRIYTDEIDRLAEKRRELIHGDIQSKVENHRSSEDVKQATHIFPASEKNAKREG